MRSDEGKEAEIKSCSDTHSQKLSPRNSDVRSPSLPPMMNSTVSLFNAGKAGVDTHLGIAVSPPPPADLRPPHLPSSDVRPAGSCTFESAPNKAKKL